MTYTATPMELDQKDDLLRLWRDNFEDRRVAEVAEQRFDWLYRGNPAGPMRTWFGRAGGGPIGCGSFFPRVTWIAGQPVQAGIVCDFAVDADHRTAGAAIAIQRAIARGSRAAGFELLYGWPNQASEPIFKRIGYATVAKSSVWSKPLHTAGKLRRWLRSPLLARVAGLAVDGALAINDRRRLLAWRGRFETAVVDRPDARFDDLWRRAAHLYTMGDKGSAYLAWRYVDSPLEPARFFSLYEAGSGALLGYVAYGLGDRAAIVHDLMAVDVDRHLAPLLLSFARRASDEGAGAVWLTCAGDQRVMARLPGLGFYPREGARSFMVLIDKAAPAGLRDAVLDPNRWLLCNGELDI